MASKNSKHNENISMEEKHGYSEQLEDILDHNEMPKEFDTWTIQEQKKWLKKEVFKNYPDMSKNIEDIFHAYYRQLIWDRPLDELPEWMDLDKYRRGQKFVSDHIGMLSIVKLLSLILVYIFNTDLKPIIITGRSHTPYLSFKRYISTARKVLNWYAGEPWIKGTKAYKDVETTRRMHLAIRSKLCGLTKEQIDDKTKFANPWCPDRELLLQDFIAACPFRSVEERAYTRINKSLSKSINNADISVVQAGFIFFPVLYPRKFGIHGATDEDLEAFIHMWRYYGYVLGLEDEYNFCRGSLADIKQRLKDFQEHLITPNLKNANPEWEHMTRCIVELINFLPMIRMPYKSTILLITDALGINMPRLYASLHYTEWIIYKLYQFVLQHMMKFSFVRASFNCIVNKMLHVAENYSPEKLKELREKSEKLVPYFQID